MCDGRWLMRDRRLLTLDEADLQSGARDVARRIDAFLIQREQSVLQKLIAIGGAAEQESFEIQVKARLASEASVLARSRATTSRSSAGCTTTSTTRISSSTIPGKGRLRYREDEFLDEQNQVVNARARLTLTGPSREGAFGSVLLFRSRFLRPGDALAALLSRVLQAGTRDERSRRIADAGSSPTAACSSTCTSIAC